MSMVGVGLALLTMAAAGRGTPPKLPLAPPNVLNLVHHRLKRRAPASYRALEASIVSAYERAKVPLYWLTFQSLKDPHDILYLNLFETTEQLNRAAETYRSMAPAHPELVRLQGRLAALIEGQNSTLTTRRDEVAYTRNDVDFATMRALLLVTFRVKPGHEGRFMDGIRAAAAGGAPWVVYEANEDSTFVLVAPMRSRAEAKRVTPIPRAVRELRGFYRRAEPERFVFSSAMSRLPAEFVAARSRSTAPKPRAQ